VLHLSGYNYKSIYGMNYRVKEKITMADLAFRVQHVIKTEVDVTEAQLSRNNIEMLVGIASFEDPTHVRVTNSRGSTVYETKNVLIATGTKPAASAKVPINGRSIINSDLVLDLPNLPKTMIIVGGGVIGVEYTCMFSALGVRVTLIERRPARHARDHAAERRGRIGGGDAGRNGRREPRKQEEGPGRRAALCRRAAGQCG
jgi:NAD(P) transhydrogenase